MRNLRDEARWIIGEIDEAKRLAKAVGKPQLGTSSIEAGRVEEYDQDGALVQIIGEQYDGTHAPVTVNGPNPPEPAGLSLTIGVGSVEARWNGKFAGDAVSPMDFSHVSLHGSRPEVFTPSNETQLATIAGELGDVATVILEPGEWTFGLVAVSKAGKWSELSETVTVEIPDYPAPVDIQDELILLDEKYDGVITEAGNLGNRLDQAEQELTSHEGRLEQAEMDVTTALSGDVDIDRLAIGNGVIRDLVAQHIAAKTAAFQQVDVKNLFATTGTMTEAVINKLFTEIFSAHKVTAQMIAVGDFQNLATLDPVRGVNISVPASWATITDGDYARTRPGGPAYLMFKDKTDTVPFKAGDKLRVTFDAVSTLSTSQSVALWLWTYQTRVDAVPQVNGPTFSGGTFSIGPAEQSYTSTITIGESLDANSKSWIVGLSGTGTTNIKIRNVRVYRMNGGEMIIDGSVLARHIDVEDLAANTGFIADLTARIVKSEMFVGQEFQGGVFTGAVIQSPRGGAGYQLTENGYTSRDAAGNVTVRLPADGTPAQFRGDVEARSLTASGRVSMQAQGNEIASGAELILEAGVTPPLTPPTVGNSYTSIELPRLGSIDGRNMNGLARAANLWWRASHDAGLMLHGIDSSGAIVRTISTGMAGSNGLTAIGNELFVLGRWTGDSSPRSVAVYDATTGAYLRRWDYAQYGSGTYQPGIGTNGTDLYIVHPDANGKVIWRSFNKTTGALISTVDTAHNIKSDMAGIYRGTADFGVDRVAVTRVNGTTEVFTPTGTHQPYAGWYPADGNAAQGLVWHDGRFWQLQYDTLVAYSNITAPSGAGVGDTDDWWVAATWKGANGAETTVGPPQRFTFLRRAELQLTAGTLPAGATGVAFYLAKKITSPSRTDLHLLASVNGPNARITTLPSNWAAQPSPPSSNTFNNASPGQIRSRAENFKVDGAGSGRWGPLTFHADGTMTSAAVPEWVPITSFLNGCTVGDFGFVPAYRSWPDGKVELRGVVKGELDAVKTVFSLPSAVRPTSPVNLVAATSGGGTSTGVMRVEFGSLATPDAMSVVPQGARRLWVSLDGLYYYQS